MDATDYQCFTRTTAMYRGPLEDTNGQVMYCMLGLTGETGEVAEKLKKHLRGGGNLEELKGDPGLCKELGDVFWYLVQLCDVLGFDANIVLETNVAKLKDRQKRGVVHGEGDER